MKKNGLSEKKRYLTALFHKCVAYWNNPFLIWLLFNFLRKRYFINGLGKIIFFLVLHSGRVGAVSKLVSSKNKGAQKIKGCILADSRRGMIGNYRETILHKFTLDDNKY